MMKSSKASRASSAGKTTAGKQVVGSVGKANRKATGKNLVKNTGYRSR